jgi:hypothetical protein
MTIANLFTQLDHNVYQTIADPANEQDTSLIDAGIAVEYALSQATVSYPGILQHTPAHLHKLASKDLTLQRVEQVIKTLQIWAAGVIGQDKEQLSSIDAEPLVKALPFRAIAPRLERVTLCSREAGQGKVRLVCHGYFHRIERKECEPRLAWGKHSFTPISKQPECVEFDVPAHLFVNKGHLLKGELHVPYSFVGPLHDAILPVFVKRISSNN